MVWMVHVNASTSRQSPSVKNSAVTAAASCACNAVSKLSSQYCASASAVACFLSAMFIMEFRSYACPPASLLAYRALPLPHEATSHPDQARRGRQPEDRLPIAA